jgi:hypothetical protein
LRFRERVAAAPGRKHDRFAREIIASRTGLDHGYADVFFHERNRRAVSIDDRFTSDSIALNDLL